MEMFYMCILINILMCGTESFENDAIKKRSTAAEESGALIMGLDSVNRVPNEYLVILRPDLHMMTSSTAKEHYVNQFIENITKYRLSFVKKFIFTKLLVVALKTDQQSVIEEIAKMVEVQEVHVNEKHHLPEPRKAVKVNSPEIHRTSSTNDETCQYQDSGMTVWGLSRIAQRQIPGDYSSSRYSYLSEDGEGVTVYVFDSGVYIEHEEFEGRASRGFTASRLEETEGENDRNGHGTHCAGTIAGKTYGVAKKARIIAVKVFDLNGSSDSTSLLEGYTWMLDDFITKKVIYKDEFKAIVSASIGFPQLYIGDGLAQELLNAGLLVVAAAGNEYDDACNYSPARVSGVVTVGATDSMDKLADFSNYGACVDILAPGVDVLSAGIGHPSASAAMSGTSMATPHVAGAIASYLSRLRSMISPADTKALIINSATYGEIDMHQPGLDNLTNAERLATPNLLLHISCDTVTTTEAVATLSPGLTSRINITYNIVVTILVFFVLIITVAITAALFSGYSRWVMSNSASTLSRDVTSLPPDVNTSGNNWNLGHENPAYASP